MFLKICNLQNLHIHSTVNNTSGNDHESDNENADDRSCWDIYDDTLTAQEMNELYAAQSKDDEFDQNDI